ncbi:leucine-rich repeat LGI family member 3-like [Nilaparvata lugens]|nr:leucine-rich repeat LGI family member 3-like [Nilaparvata lugens]
MVFDNLNSLENLNLQNNKLKHIPEDVMEPVVDTLRIVDVMDNPLVCDCQLRWYGDWLRNLKGKDDDFMQKKRLLCTMVHEHREYMVQKLPLDKMNCIGKNLIGRASSSSSDNADVTFHGWQYFVTSSLLLATNHLYVQFCY